MISTRLSNECGNRQRKSDESKTTYFLTHVDFAEQKIKVTPHDESPFQENARRALNF